MGEDPQWRLDEDMEQLELETREFDRSTEHTHRALMGIESDAVVVEEMSGTTPEASQREQTVGGIVIEIDDPVTRSPELIEDLALLWPGSVDHEDRHLTSVVLSAADGGPHGPTGCRGSVLWASPRRGHRRSPELVANIAEHPAFILCRPGDPSLRPLQENAMQPRITFDRTIVTVVDDDIVHLLVELEAPPAPDSGRQPLDVVLVLDKSGSMSGEPLKSVKAATEHFLRLAGPEDRVGVVAFDDSADLVLELATHQFDTAAARIRRISTGGSTNLSGGWLKAIEMLEASARPEALRRVIILTDGQANVGETDPDRLASIAASARSRSITTTTIGFGEGYDERLLAIIADAGTGNDYWCAGPDHAPQIFNDEFEGLASTVAQNVSVELRPASELIGMRVLNEFPITVVSGGVQVALGDAYGSERRRVVAELLLPPVRTEGPFPLGEVVVRWSTFGDAIELHTTTIPLGIGVSADPDVVDTDADPAVREQVNILRAAEERRNALEAYRRHDHAAASAAFSSAAMLLTEIGGDADLIEELTTDALRMSGGDWDEMSSKKHFSERRMVNKGRRTRYDK